MRRLLLLLLPITLASCGSKSEFDSRKPADVSPQGITEDVSSEGPAIRVSAAPGVAFNYNYTFDLAAKRIEAVQEEHVQACEKLGLSRCRITGMRYRLLGEDRIDAMLALKLDPSIARQFGKSAIDAVTRAEGTLVDSEITGEDADAGIKAANRNVVQLTEELHRIEAQLARKGLSAVERDRLQSEASQLRQSIRASQDSRADREESLATTPMTFTYGTEKGGPSLGQAVTNAKASFVTGVSVLLVVLITLLPWLTLAALVWMLVRFIKPGWKPRRQDAALPPEAA
jgi:hypothetical protein